MFGYRTVAGTRIELQSQHTGERKTAPLRQTGLGSGGSEDDGLAGVFKHRCVSSSLQMNFLHLQALMAVLKFTVCAPGIHLALKMLRTVLAANLQGNYSLLPIR